MSLIHPHTVISSSHRFHPRRQMHTAPPLYARRHAIQKQTSKVGANPESRLTLSIHQLYFFSSTRSLRLTQMAGEGGTVGIYCLLHTLVEYKRVFHNLQCQMHSRSSPAYS